MKSERLVRRFIFLYTLLGVGVLSIALSKAMAAAPTLAELKDAVQGDITTDQTFENEVLGLLFGSETNRTFLHKGNRFTFYRQDAQKTLFGKKGEKWKIEVLLAIYEDLKMNQLIGLESSTTDDGAHCVLTTEQIPENLRALAESFKEQLVNISTETEATKKRTKVAEPLSDALKRLEDQFDNIQRSYSSLEAWEEDQQILSDIRHEVAKILDQNGKLEIRENKKLKRSFEKLLKETIRKEKSVYAGLIGKFKTGKFTPDRLADFEDLQEAYLDATIDLIDLAEAHRSVEDVVDPDKAVDMMFSSITGAYQGMTRTMFKSARDPELALDDASALGFSAMDFGNRLYDDLDGYGSLDFTSQAYREVHSSALAAYLGRFGQSEQNVQEVTDLLAEADELGVDSSLISVDLTAIAVSRTEEKIATLEQLAQNGTQGIRLQAGPNGSIQRVPYFNMQLNQSLAQFGREAQNLIQQACGGPQVRVRASSNSYLGGFIRTQGSTSKTVFREPNEAACNLARQTYQRIPQLVQSAQRSDRMIAAQNERLNAASQEERQQMYQQRQEQEQAVAYMQQFMGSLFGGGGGMGGSGSAPWSLPTSGGPGMTFGPNPISPSPFLSQSGGPVFANGMAGK